MINLVIAGIVSVSCIIAIIIYHSNANNVFKLVAMPFIFSFFMFTITVMYDIMGAPIEGFPPPEFNYIHHEAVNQGEEIIVWVEIERKHRIYIFEYTRENMKKLEEAKEEKEGQQGQQGVPMKVTDNFRIVPREWEAERDVIGSDENIKNATENSNNGPRSSGL